MQLDYQILWFDDQQQAIQPFVGRVQGMISRLGFEPKVDLRIITADVAEPLANLPHQSEIDLVLMDWKLGGQHDGADLAHKLRRSFRDTDFIFYSSEPPATLRQLIFNKGIDGVFCVSREHLSDRANGIIQGQLRRVLDLNHMRGIVMAATRDLDLGMIDCLELVQKVLYTGEDGAAGYANEIAGRISKALRSKAKDWDWDCPGLVDTDDAFAPGVSSCPRPVPLTPLSSAVRWSIWSVPGATRPTSPASLNRPLRPSGTG